MMSIAEQHKIVNNIIERHKFETTSIYNYKKGIDNKVFWINLITEVVTYFNVTITTIYPLRIDNIVFRKSIQELQETCFQDLLNPTENELTLFELTYGFKWPLQICCEPIAHGLNPQPLTGETNETS